MQIYSCPRYGVTNKFQLEENNLVYWDDPNELVDRLRLSLTSQTLKNTEVGNEILSIFEELREAVIMKRIQNV